MSKLSRFCRHLLEIVDNVPNARVNARAVGRDVPDVEWQIQVVIEPWDISHGRHVVTQPTYSTQLQITGGSISPKQLKGR